MIEVGTLCHRFNEDSSPLCLLLEAVTDERAQTIKDQFTRMQKDGLLAITRRIHRIAITHCWWIGFEQRQEPVHRPWTEWSQGKKRIQIAFNPDVNEWSRLLHKMAHVARQEFPVGFLLHPGPESWQFLLDGPAAAKQCLFPRAECFDLLFRQRAFNTPLHGAGIASQYHLLHVRPQRHALKELADHIKDLIRPQFPAHALHFL